MHWLAYFIFTYIVVGVQLGMGQSLTYAGATPNLLLIAAVFVAGGARRNAAVIGAFLLGLSQDLLSATPIGLFALCYGLTALVIGQARKVTTPDHPLANVLMILVGGIITAIIVWLQYWIRPPGGVPPADNGVVLQPISIAVGLWPLLLSAFYSALLSIPLLWALGKLKPLFGFRTHRQRW